MPTTRKAPVRRRIPGLSRDGERALFVAVQALNSARDHLTSDADRKLITRARDLLFTLAGGED